MFTMAKKWKPKRLKKPQKPSADTAGTGASSFSVSSQIPAVGASAADILGGLVPERVATPERCRDEAFRLFEEIETWQGKELAAAVEKDIFKRFGDLAGQRRKESKQSFGRFRKILLRNTFELLQIQQIQYGKDLGTTTAAKKLNKLYPKEFPSWEAVEKMIEKLGLGVRKGRGKKKPT